MSNAPSFCDKIGNKLSELGKWYVWQNIILGQFLSLLLCTTNTIAHYYINASNGAKNTVLKEFSITTTIPTVHSTATSTVPSNLNSTSSTSVVPSPTVQSFPHYMFLCAIYTSWLAFRRGNRGLISIIKARGWRYLLLCLIDVQANTLMSTAHQFTTLTSIQLLGCVAIPVTLALSCLVLGIRYRMVHIIAVSVCLMGVGCLVWANIVDTKVDGKNQLVGDMLCLGGAILFAIVTVLQELSVKKTDIVEYLGLLGLFGSIISGIQMLILEKQILLSSTWKTSNALLSSFSAGQFMFCTFSSLFLTQMGTTALHLSLLSGNFYTLIVGVLFFNYKFHALYFLSFTLTMIGVYIYAIKQTPLPITQDSNSNNGITTNQQIPPPISSKRSECQLREHNISINDNSPDHTTDILSTFGTLNSNDTFPLSHSTNTTFTSFYGSHDVLNQTSTSC